MSRDNGAPKGALLALLLVLFAASGSAALIYEIVWYHLLRQAIGASAVSLAIVLTSFMGGICLGSFFFPRLIAPGPHPLRVYASSKPESASWASPCWSFCLPSGGSTWPSSARVVQASHCGPSCAWSAYCHRRR